MFLKRVASFSCSQGSAGIAWLRVGKCAAELRTEDFMPCSPVPHRNCSYSQRQINMIIRFTVRFVLVFSSSILCAERCGI